MNYTQKTDHCINWTDWINHHIRLKSWGRTAHVPVESKRTNVFVLGYRLNYLLT
jgi:hypothetical protein